MAAEVLDYQRFSTVPRSADGPFQAMSSSLQSMQHLLSLLSQQQVPPAQHAAAADCRKAIALIGRLGHARYRRPPSGRPSPPALLQQMPTSPASSPSHMLQSPSAYPLRDLVQTQASFPAAHRAQQLGSMAEELAAMPRHMDCNLACGPFKQDATSDQHADHGVACKASAVPSCSVDVPSLGDAGMMNEHNVNGSVHDATTCPIVQICGDVGCRMERDRGDCALTKTNGSFVSSLSVEERGGTVSSGKPLFSSARPPLPPKKRKTSEKDEEIVKKCHKLGQCHCSEKRRKLHSRTEVRVIAAPSYTMNSNTEVPDDGYSWCVYGQKLVESSIYPRVYYKCSTVRDCPARKHVQRDSKNKDIFIVTYGRRHAHPRTLKLAKPSV